MGSCASNTSNRKRSHRNPSLATVKLSPGIFLTITNGSLSSNYVELNTIGSGAFAEVKLCIYKPLNQKRAVKIIHKSGLHYQQLDPDYMLKEIKVLMELDHPNILRCYEIFSDNWRFFIATEYCEGGELFDRIVKLKKFSEKNASSLMYQLLSAVDHCHEKGVIHRDLKPENILLEGSGANLSIKVADFGSSCFIDPAKRLTGCFGSAYYVAPEVLGGIYNEKCDIWSCGVILFVLLTGKPPYSGRNDKEIMAQVRYSPLEINETRFPELSSLSVDLLQKLLVIDPKQRISAAEAIKHPWLHSFSGTSDSVTLSKTLENLTAFNSSIKLKEAVYIYLATQVSTSDELAALKQDFQKIDANGDGKLSREELLAQYQRTMNEEEAKKVVNDIINELDANHNGSIDYAEFITACMNHHSILSKNNLDVAFRMFDKDSSGDITKEEVKSILGLGNHVDEAVWQELMNEVDENHDGVIDIKEFINIMLK